MKVSHKGAIPFVLLLIPYLIGITAGIHIFPGASPTILVIISSVLAGVFVVFNLLYNKWLYKARWLGGSLLFILLIVTGIINLNQSIQINNSAHFSHTPAQYLTIKISTEPVQKNEAFKFTATVVQNITGDKKIKTGGNLLISIKDKKAGNLYYGDILLIPAKYYAVDPPFNPAEFNYKRYLANKNIYHQAYLYPNQFVVLKSNAGNPIIAYALRLRQRLVNKLKANLHNPDAAAVASTLILGYKAELSDEVLQAYSKTGTIHVLSVSGAHVGLVYVVLAFMLGFLNRYRHGRLIKAVIIILLIWFYALLTGFSPPVCRAAVMLSLIISGQTYNRYINSLNILAFSAFMMLLVDPLLVTDVGFQLSYLAVGGLVVLQPLIYKRFEIKNRWLDKLWLICSASIAAQVITFPLSAYYFHQVPVYFLISNLFILLPSAVVMYGGILYLFLPQEFFLTKWLGYVLEQVILFINNGLSIIEHTPFASINKIWLTTWEYLLLYGIIFILFWVIDKRNKLLAGLGIGLSLLFCISVITKHVDTGKTNQMVFLNLRKNQGIIFRKADKAVVLTNLSVKDKAFSYSIQPYLDSCKVSDVTISGFDADINSSFFNKKGNRVSFLKQEVAIVDKTSGQLENTKTAFIYITGNPKTDSLLSSVKPGIMLVIDGSNSKKTIAMLQQRAKQLTISYKTLSRNKAFIVTSNK